MPKIFYCLKCSTAVYEHSRWCRSKETEIFHYNSKGSHCEADDPNMDKNRTQIFEPHELVDLHRNPYCSWKRDYSTLKRVYVRIYNPDKWMPIGWYCTKCGSFIDTTKISI